jgi:hypothetical protein
MRRAPGLLLAIVLNLTIDGAGAAEEIRIGFATPLTGPFATTGARHRTAVELAVKDLNERGGVLVHPVRLVSADDACGIEEAEAAAQQLVDAGVRPRTRSAGRVARAPCSTWRGRPTSGSWPPPSPRRG